MVAIPTARFRTALASFALFALACDLPSSAQEGTTAPPSTPALSAEQVAELVAPIALYPDALLGQVLTASTYPLEVVKAARWSKSNPKVKGPELESAMQQQPWDPSVKSLTAVPQVLAMMSEKLEWTQALGDAYLAQPDDIAAAVQQLRARADGAGNLKPSNEQRIRRVAAPAPVNVGEPQAADYYIIEPVDPDVIYVPIYDPYRVYGVWPYPTYRSFYWSPPGYVAVGVLAFGAPIVVGAALWATYDWRARRVAIDVNRFNTFNRTVIANQTWQHNPNHRGNLPYSSPVLQQQFGKTATGVQGLSKTGIGSQGLPKSGTTLTNPQLLPKGAKAGPDTTNRNINPGSPKQLGNPKTLTNPQLLPKGAKAGPDTTNVNRNINPGSPKQLGNPKTTPNPVNPNLNKNVTVNRDLNVNRNVGVVNRPPTGSVGPQGLSKGAAKGAKGKGPP